MIEAIAASVEKIAEASIEKAATFFDKLESSVEVAKSEIEQKTEAVKKFWDELESKEKDIDKAKNEEIEEDKAEQTKEARQEYIDDLKANSEHPETIQDDSEAYEKNSPEETAKKREEFNDTKSENGKEALIKKWEETHGKEWPRYEKDYFHNGKRIRKEGDRYDAHHIHPLSMGGKNEVSNITPMHAEKHFDKQGVHAHDSPYGKLEKMLQEDKTNETK